MIWLLPLLPRGCCSSNSLGEPPPCDEQQQQQKQEARRSRAAAAEAAAAAAGITGAAGAQDWSHVVGKMRGLRILLLLHFLLLLVAHAAAASDGSEAEGSVAAASSSVDGDDGFDGEAGDSDVDGSSRDTPTMETGQPTLLDLMRAARLERTLINKPRGRKTGISAYINSTQIMAVIVTVIVILYCIRIRTRRYTPDVRRSCGLGFRVLGFSIGFIV